MSEAPVAPRRLSGNKRAFLLAVSVGLFISGPAIAPAGYAGSVARAAEETKSAPTSTEVALKDMRDELRRLHRAALDLINDVEERRAVVVGQPLFREPTVNEDDLHAHGMERMFSLGDALPPKKKWLDLTMAEIEKLIGFIAEDRAAIVIPPDQKAGLAESEKELDARVNDIQQHLKNLKPLTAGPKYDNIAIGKEALGLYQDSEKFEKPWKEILNGVRQK